MTKIGGKTKAETTISNYFEDTGVKIKYGERKEIIIVAKKMLNKSIKQQYENIGNVFSINCKTLVTKIKELEAIIIAKNKDHEMILKMKESEHSLKLQEYENAMKLQEFEYKLKMKEYELKLKDKEIEIFKLNLEMLAKNLEISNMKK